MTAHGEKFAVCFGNNKSLTLVVKVFRDYKALKELLGPFDKELSVTGVIQKSDNIRTLKSGQVVKVDTIVDRETGTGRLLCMVEISLVAKFSSDSPLYKWDVVKGI